MELRYSSLESYIALARSRLPPEGNTETVDFLPYRESTMDVWSGYYASRPLLKVAVRAAERFVRLAELHGAEISPLAHELLGVLQHHDAITGTCTEHVYRDYLRMAHVAMCEAARALTNSKMPCAGDFMIFVCDFETKKIDFLWKCLIIFCFSKI